MQIPRTKRINDYYIFQNWRRLGDMDFACFNVIYGGNGSGRSTFAPPLVKLAGGDWSSGTRLAAKDDDSNPNSRAREVSKPDKALAIRLCISNAGYVKKNLQFDSGEAESLLFLGKESTDNQKRHEEFKAAIDEANSSTIPQLENQFETIESKHSEIGRNGATRIASKLQGTDASYDGRRYKRPQFIRVLDNALQSPPRDMSDFDVDQQIERIASSVTDRITELSDLGIPLTDIDAQTSRVLAQTVISEAINALKSNHKAIVRIQEGIQLHRAGDRCLLCERVYTEECIDRLNRHFGGSLKRVQKTIKILDTQLITYEEQCEQLARSLEPPRSLDETRTKYWLSRTDAIRGFTAAVKERFVFLRQQLTRKQGELFQPLTLKESSTDSSPSGKMDVEIPNAIINKHNDDIDNCDQLKKQVCGDVVQYCMEQVCEGHAASKEAAQEVESKLDSTQKQFEANKAELK